MVASVSSRTDSKRSISEGLMGRRYLVQAGDASTRRATRERPSRVPDAVTRWGLNGHIGTVEVASYRQTARVSYPCWNSRARRRDPTRGGRPWSRYTRCYFRHHPPGPSGHTRLSFPGGELMPGRGRCPPGAPRHCRAVLGVQTCHTAAALLEGRHTLLATEANVSGALLAED